MRNSTESRPSIGGTSGRPPAATTTTTFSPLTRSPHPIRRGSITWQRNLGLSAETVAERAAATPSVIRRYYDDPEFGDELERRRGRTESIDVREHLHPEDLEVSS
ncbi:hypothetical protein [Halorhabdus rudnickae]|uniref:hypothetical protein n=1 Tax=Halorhabdus rudnickae TaxID=1775544 RepID=UPI001FCE4EC2|nr:hypothetical protein [Halorhabdus rudnickae]